MTDSVGAQLSTERSCDGPVMTGLLWEVAIAAAIGDRWLRSTCPSGRPESVPWTAEQLRRFLAGTRDNRHGTAYLVLATTGLRRGEALGLRWRDLDLDAGRAAIRQTVIAVRHTPMLGTPKTAKSRRTITLDKGTVAALREHRKARCSTLSDSPGHSPTR